MIFWLGRATASPYVYCLPVRLQRALGLLLCHRSPPPSLSRGSHTTLVRFVSPACRKSSPVPGRPLKAARPLCTTAAKSTEATEVQKQLSIQAPRGTRWRKVRQWVVFSDLHLSHKTLGTVLEVLERVHQEASQRDAGILFLGAYASP